MHNATINYDDAVKAFAKLGVASGDTLLFHSSIKSICWIDGGAKTIADALVHAIGLDGTLVAPCWRNGARARMSSHGQ